MGSQGGAGRGVASSLAPPLPPPEADFSEFTYTTNTTPTRPDPTSFDSSRPHLRAATGRTQEVTAVVVAMSKNCRDRPSGNDVLAMHPGHVYELHGGSTPVTSVLKSPFITVENTKCVGFYYWIGGTENASLTVSVEKNDGTSVSESLQLVKMAEPGWRVVEMGRHRYYGEQMKVVFYPDGLQWFTSASNSEHTINGPMEDIKYYCAIYEIMPHHRPGDIGRMISPTVAVTSLESSFCFNFMYSACCEHGGILSVIMIDIASNNETILWQLPITYEHADSQCHEGQAAVKNPPDNFALIIQGEEWDGREGYVAIKHTNLEESLDCPLKPNVATPKSPSIPPPSTFNPPMTDTNTLNCDFENASYPTCDYMPGEMGSWIRVNASDPPSAYNPIVDNTFKNESGHYIMAEYPYPTTTEVAVQLKTPELDPKDDHCCTFFLHYVGDEPLPGIVYAEFVFEAEAVKNDSKAVIGIDDVYFSTDECMLGAVCD